MRQRFARLLLLSSMVGGALASPAQAQTIWNGYAGTNGVTLTYAPTTGQQNPFLHYLGVGLTAGTTPLPSQLSSVSQSALNSWTVDTGSQGTVITANLLSIGYGINYRSFNQPSTQTLTYTSSGYSYTGFWQNLNVGLYSASQNGSATLAATSAQMPVFIATSYSTTKGDSASYAGCPSSCSVDTLGSLEQFGIGFGRGYPNNGYPLPEGRAISNPLLNLTSVTNGSLASMAPGYVVTPTGLQLGLTPAQLANTTFVKLLPIPVTGQTNTTAYRIAATASDWQTPAMAVTINGAASGNGTFYGTVLVDTGIANVELGNGVGKVELQYDPPNAISTVQVFLPGQASASAGQPASYTLVYQGACTTNPGTCPPGTWSNPNGLSPIYPVNSKNASTDGFAIVIPSAIAPDPTINTGSQFLNYFDIVYDPVSGFFGYTSTAAHITDNNPETSPAIALQAQVPIAAGTTVTLPTFLFEQLGGSQNVQLSTTGSVTLAGPIASAIVCQSGLCTVPTLEATSGTFVLTGANTYPGTTQIDAGATLALAGAGTIATSAGVVANGTFDVSGTPNGTTIQTLSGSGTVALGGRTLTLGAANGVFSGVVQDGGLSGGTGGGLQVAAGMQVLSGANTYTGATTIAPGGTLALAGGGQIGRSSGVAANGTFDISATSAGAAITSLSGTGAVALGAQTLTLTNASGTFAGTIGGTGGVAVVGGTQGLTGANTYSGGTTVTGGATLAVASDAALGASNGALTLNDGTLLALGTVTSARTLLVQSGGGVLNAGAFGITFNGPVTIGGPLSTLGNVVLTNGGSATATLAVNGDVSGTSLYVAESGTLRGVGRVHAPTRVDGTLAPGNSPGTLTFTAPLTLGARAVSRFEIDGTGTATGAGNYSRAVLTGSAGSFAANGTLRPQLRGIGGSATNTYTPPLGQMFQIVSAQGGVSGSYTGLEQPSGLAAGTRFDALYTPSSVDLIVTPASFGNLSALGLSQTANQAAVGGALDAARPAAGVAMTPSQAATYTPLYLLPGAALPATLEQLAPTIYGDALMVSRGNWYLVSGAIADQLEARRGSRMSGSAQATTEGDRTVWITGLGQFGDVSSNGTAGYGSSTGGAAGGVDMAFHPGALDADLVAGAAFGFTNQSTSAKNAASYTGQALQLMVYGSARRGIAFLEAQAGGLFTEGTATRPLGLYGTQAKGDTGGAGGGGGLRAGVRLPVGSWEVEPSIMLAGLGLSQGSLTESQGGAGNLAIAGASIGSLQTQVGVRAERRFALGDGMSIVPAVQVGWLHEYLDTAATIGAAFLGAPSATFGVQSATIGHDWAVLGVRAALDTAGPVSGYAGYTGTVNGSATAQTVTAGVRVVW